ncbi:RsmD family RNA methyltransferase [Aquibacillus koreensis]|uniref:RsmD family RNA methyltransferase n=1 Tax=Aquibacillus koreensis TaxID=279446 RepID=A0A9X3WM08_9BACI|nr:RsmD family RNA methyltransferase [Aquibacillus koreensis]MCT2535224.1 RsmD family RNA methyltransferase [Aquibacillus koreensis]MDC3421083.1 RsmD family RNA methyltransferase [Aquibacillus koreensis]
MNCNNESTKYVYNYACAEEELSLCRLEMRSFFGFDSNTGVLESTIAVELNRSPFIRERIDVIFEANTTVELKTQVEKLPSTSSTFKVKVMTARDIFKTDSSIRFEVRRKMEREIGLSIPGKADLQNPDIIYAVMEVDGRWVFGNYHKSEPIWLSHKSKPASYSTALNTRVARAIVNIAVPKPVNVKVIDPCCGIGTVLVEALSMGINIVGSDHNPLVMRGIRENIKYFGYDTEVTLKDIRDVEGQFDVVIIDMPYNLCSVISQDEQLEIIKSARRLAQKMVVVTVEPLDSILKQVGFNIKDRCEIHKRKFKREIIVCD